MSVTGVPKYGYMPFGAGPRSCIGSRMALTEMRITLGMILDQCEWKITNSPDDAPLEAEGSFKIRLSQPVMVMMNARSGGTSRRTLHAN
jgi:cytochrome P450